MPRTIYHGSFTLTRRYKAKPSRVFQAFSDKDTKARWFRGDEEGYESYQFEMDFRIGGRDFFRFKHGSFPEEMFNEGFYLDIVPNELIVHAYAMGTAAGRFSASLQTLSFAPDGTGTLLTFDEYGSFFDNPDAARMREEGTRGLLEAIASVVDGA